MSRAGTPDAGIAQRFPIGTRLRILPNHACATGAQHPEYQAIGEDGGARAALLRGPPRRVTRCPVVDPNLDKI